eukprot:TRINITY_DN27082_c0_g1_i4.p1 TRINITY_DN27082_c0_g1~~TRINITY_DN27082_c0_g1_i4.p1  ORF type:complete len:318 (+),score=34.17 TRINITY_DN27082_c0_g1_i4:24-977(+)
MGAKKEAERVLEFPAGATTELRAAMNVVVEVATDFMREKIGTHPMQADRSAKVRREEFGTVFRDSMIAMQDGFKRPDHDWSSAYSSEIDRVGYLLKYSVYNALILAAVLYEQGCHLISPCRVACIGGGPGTEVIALGLLERLLPDRKLEFSCTIHDLPVWRAFIEGENMKAALRRLSTATVCYQDCDLRAPAEQGNLVGPADLYILSYVVNEMANHSTAFLNRFRDVLSVAPANSLVLILERTRSLACSLVEEIAALRTDRFSLETLVMQERVALSLPAGFVVHLTRFVRKFHIKPRTSGGACVTLLRVVASAEATV